jgi:hypothetical protein
MDFEVEANHKGLDLSRTNKLGYLMCLVNLGVMVLCGFIIVKGEKARDYATIDFDNIE